MEAHSTVGRLKKIGTLIGTYFFLYWLGDLGADSVRIRFTVLNGLGQHPLLRS